MASPFEPRLSLTAKKATVKVNQKLSKAAGADAGDNVTLELASEASEPTVPADLRQGARGRPKARALWAEITISARTDWIHWNHFRKAEQRRARVGSPVPAQCSLAGSDAFVASIDPASIASASALRSAI